MRRVFAFLLTALTFFGGSATWANDSFVDGAGGRVVRMTREHSAIRMVREAIHLDLYPGYYDTQVDFLFANETAAPISVQMGFPESGFVGTMRPEDQKGYIHRTAFRQFSTTVDGKPLLATRRKASLDASGGYRAYWVKTVSFAPNAQRRVQVRYRSSYGSISSGALLKYVYYDFTGGNWRGLVDESSLRVTFHTPGTFAAGAFMLYRPFRMEPVVFQQAGTTLTTAWQHWTAEAHLSLALDPTLPGALMPARPAIYEPIDLHGAPLYALTIPGARQKIANIFNNTFLPPAVLRKGIVYAREDRLDALLFPDHPRSADVLAAQGTLTVAGKSFSFREGDTAARYGDRTLTLPKPPIFLKGGREDENKGTYTSEALYVPLKPIVDALGGRMTVDADRHRITVSAPR